jgi:hypothetical protein
MTANTADDRRLMELVIHDNRRTEVHILFLKKLIDLSTKCCFSLFIQIHFIFARFEDLTVAQMKLQFV